MLAGQGGLSGPRQPLMASKVRSPRPDVLRRSKLGIAP
jgi:hypothetical protein